MEVPSDANSARPCTRQKKIVHEPEDEEIDETYLTLEHLLRNFNRPQQTEGERRRAQREAHRRFLFEGSRVCERNRGNRSTAERRIRSRVWGTTCSLPPPELINRNRWNQDDEEDDEYEIVLHPAIIRSSFQPPTQNPKLEVVMTKEYRLLKSSVPRAVRALSCTEGRLLKPPKTTWYLRSKNMEVQ